MSSTTSKTLDDSEEKEKIDNPEDKEIIELIKKKINKKNKIIDNSDLRFGFAVRKLNELENDINSDTVDEMEFLETLLDYPLHTAADMRLAYTAAGWPSWLVQVAPEAVRGWIPRGINGFKIIGEVIFLILGVIHCRITCLIFCFLSFVSTM